MSINLVYHTLGSIGGKFERTFEHVTWGEVSQCCAEPLVQFVSDGDRLGLALLMPGVLRGEAQAA